MNLCDLKKWNMSGKNFLLLAVMIQVLIGKSNTHTEKWWNLIIPVTYSKEESPVEHLEKNGNKIEPTVVECTFLPHVIADISMQKMDFQVDLQLFFKWRDSRLLRPKKDLASSYDFANLPVSIAEQIWMPLILFTNCKGCSNTILEPKEQVLYCPDCDLNILIVLRKMFSFTCEIDLRRYPFDNQECSIVLFSFEPPEYVQIVANSYVQDIEKISFPPEYNLLETSVKNCTIKMNHENNSTYSCHQFTFRFRREILPYVMMSYIPTLLIVILSWVSFWLDVELAGPRVALGLTSLLTLATLFNNVQSKVPSSHHLKAIDIWIFVCILMVFASLLEFAFANFLHRRKKKFLLDSDVKELKPLNNRVISYNSINKNTEEETSSFRVHIRNIISRKCLCVKSFHPKYVDQISRLIFPLIFGIFNIVYWVCYS